MKIQRRTILFFGEVQGVGFRYTAVQLSRDLRLGGTVRNLPDGRVEMVVEGVFATTDLCQADAEFGERVWIRRLGDGI